MQFATFVDLTKFMSSAPSRRSYRLDGNERLGHIQPNKEGVLLITSKSMLIPYSDYWSLVSLDNDLFRQRAQSLSSYSCGLQELRGGRSIWT